MITEDYVSFEIAKLLKDKGFNGECSRFYMPNGHGIWKYEHYHDFNISEKMDCPTIQMAIKWLREAHSIAINIGWGEILEDNFQWWCIILNQKDGSILRESEYYATYEEAAEAAIKYCIKHLI